MRWRCGVDRRAACVFAAWVALHGATAAAEEAANPFAVRAQRAHEQLKATLSSPAAIGPLFETAGLTDRVPDDQMADALALVTTPSGAAKPDPLVAAWAAFHLARFHDDHGRPAEATALRGKLGLIESFWVVGPFEAQSRSALTVPFAPEAVPVRPDPKATYEGKAQTVAWRRMPDAARMGVLLLESAVAPQQEAGALLFVYINSAQAQPAALRLGSGGPIRAWINGAPVFERQVQRVARMDQDAARVMLRKGENTLVIKTLNPEGAWRLVVRLTRPDGVALAGVTTSLEGKASAALGVFGKVKPTGVARDLGSELESAWQKSLKAKRTQEARVLANALARLWAYASPFDKDEKPVERVLTETLTAGDDFELQKLLGETAAQENDRRAALAVALRLTTDPAQRCLVLSDLAELAQTARRQVESSSLRRQAIEESAGVSCWPAVLAQAEEARVAGMAAAAKAQVDKLPSHVASLPTVRKHRARILQGLGLVAQARDELSALQSVRPADPDVADAAVANARAHADAAALVQITEKLARRRPDLYFLVADHAKALEGAGKADEGLQALEEASARVPGAAELYEAKGRLLARLGRPAEAAAALAQALSLRPQNPTLRKYAEALRKEATGGKTDEAAADLARRYAVDDSDTARQALRAAPVAKPPDAARVLLDRKVVHVHDNGLSEMFAQRLVHVLTEPGARDNESFFIRYTPGSQEVEVRQARVFRRSATGEIETSSATGRDDRDLSEPWYALYYDNRAEVVTFEGLRAGDVVEIQYTVADISARNELAGYFGDFQFVAETIPTDLWQYTLLGPKGKPFFFHTPKLAGFTKTQNERGAEVEYQFQALNVPKLIPEQSMPGWAEVAPYFHVSTYETWDQVGRWYWDLVAEQLVPDDELKRRARQAVEHKTTLESKVAAIHRAVIQGTRYVGLEFGIHGYKPYRVSQILSRRFGDCKDKASLMVAMLKVVGIDAQMVLLRTRRGGDVETLPASLAVFDHAIAYVPALDLYLDGTAEFSGMRDLPSQDQATMALRVWPGGSMLVHTPVLASTQNRALRTWKADVSEDGSALVNESVTVVGQAAPEWRQHYQTPGERLEKYGKVWNARFPGAAVEDLRLEGIDDPNEAVTVAAKINVPVLAPQQGQRLTLPLSSRPPEYLRSYARLSRRRTDLLLAYPWQHEETLEFRLPQGFSLASSPAPASIATSFGRFEFQAKPSSDGRIVTVTSRLDVQRHRFTPDEYPEFRKFLGGVEAALRGHIELQRANP